jgi:molybdenum cofactor guanylyltransferase
MNLEICILAGGLSTRLGKDKARFRFGRRTMLSIIRSEAAKLKFPVRVISRDLVPRCGPLGGIFTALKMTRANAVLFLACDMPLITQELLKRLVSASGAKMRPVIIAQDDRVGFPFILPRSAMAEVELQISEKQFSIHALAAKVKTKKLRVPTRSHELFNVNTVEDAEQAAELLAGSH